MMNCKEATRMVSDGLDRDLTLSDKLRLQMHLLICSYCRNFSKQGNFLRRAARSAVTRKSD